MVKVVKNECYGALCPCRKQHLIHADTHLALFYSKLTVYCGKERQISAKTTKLSHFTVK